MSDLCDQHTTDTVQTAVAANLIEGAAAGSDLSDTGSPVDRCTTIDRVTCETVLEVARACKNLLDAVETVDVDVTDPATLDRVTRRMSRIAFLCRIVPAVLDYRRLVCLGDMAADHPEWWRSNRLHFFCPELTHRDIAGILDLRPHQVRDAILKAEIPAECYENLPEI